MQRGGSVPYRQSQKILAFWQLKLYPNTTLTVVFVRVWLSDALQSKHVNLNPKRLNLVGR
jgi:hypothetical protein